MKGTQIRYIVPIGELPLIFHVRVFERERARKHARLFIYSFIHSLSFLYSSSSR